MEAWHIDSEVCGFLLGYCPVLEYYVLE